MEAIGIDFGGTKIAAGRITGKGELTARNEAPSPASSEAVITTLIDLAKRSMTPDTQAVGIGAAGLVRFASGEFVWGPNVPLEHTVVTDRITQELGVPVFIDNDANVAALAEQRVGAARGAMDALVVTVGTGIGGGVIVGGKIFRGAGFAGEIGHMILDVNGPLCTCGHHGCWEAMASGRVLTEAAKEIVKRFPDGALARIAGGEPVAGKMLTRAAHEGDKTSRDAIAHVGKLIGVGLANLICLFDPEIIVIGGGVCTAGDLVLDPIREVLRESYGAAHRKGPALVTAKLENDAGIIGAGFMALDAL